MTKTNDYWALARGLVLGFVVTLALFQIWAPFYPLPVAIGALVAGSGSGSLPERALRAGLLGIACAICLATPQAMNDSPYLDPVTTPRFLELWRGIQVDWFILGLSLLLGSVIAAVAPVRVTVVAVMLLLVAGIFVLPASFAPGFRDSLFLEPGDHQDNDLRMFVKTFYVMQRNGGHYYPAWVEAYTIRLHRDFNSDMLGFHPPALYFLWWVFCREMWQVYLAFQLTVSAALACLYLLTYRLTKDPLASLAAPVLWACYTGNILVSPWWALSDIWTLYWIPLCWLLMVRGKHWPASLILALAANARPLYLLLFPAAVAYCWCHRSDYKLKQWLLPGLVSACLAVGGLVLHYSYVAHTYMTKFENSGTGFRSHGGLGHLWDACNFNWNFLPYSLWTLPGLLGLAMVGLWRWRKRRETPWLLLCLAPLSIMLRMGYDRAFWYAVPFLPWFVIFVAAALSRPVKQQDAPPA